MRIIFRIEKFISLLHYLIITIQSRQFDAGVEDFKNVVNNLVHSDDAKAEDRLVTYQFNGLMSKEDKYKLDSIEDGATNFELPNELDPQIIKQNETHHKQRYRNKFNLIVCFYGSDISNEEKEIATKLVEANAINFDANRLKINFCENEEEALIRGVSYAAHNC